MLGKSIKLSMAITALTISIGIGLTVKQVFRRTVEVGDVWDAFFGRHIRIGDWLTVYTNDGNEYRGRLSSYGYGESKKEISIVSPKLILRDRVGKATRERLCGKEILFTEGDVLRIAALTSEQERR